MNKRGKKIGLALGSGSARGWVHIGVINALEEAGITIDYVAGTSIGSLIGGVFVSGKLKKLEVFARKMNRKTTVQYFDMAYSANGLLDGKKMEKLLESEFIKKKIDSSSISYTAIATDLNTGKEVRFKRGDFIRAIRASVSIPGILTPVKYKNQYLVDGGLVNPLPVSAVQDMGADIVIAVDLNAQITNKKLKRKSDSKSIIKNVERKVIQKIDRWMGKRGPNIFDVIINSINIMQHEITKDNLKVHQPDFLIQPKIGYIKPFDFHLAEELIREGYNETKKQLPAIKKMLNR